MVTNIFFYHQLSWTYAVFRCSFKVTGTRANVANCLSTGRPPLKKNLKRFVTTYTWRQISLWWWGRWFLTVAFLVTTGVVWALQVANVVVSLLYTSVTGTRCRRLARRTPKKIAQIRIFLINSYTKVSMKELVYEFGFEMDNFCWGNECWINKS